MQSPKFPAATVSFHTELKKRVNDYFAAAGKEPTGNYKLWLKAIIIVAFFLAVYIHLVFFTPPIWMACLECVLLGGLIAAIGFNIMHDGAHGSFSKYPAINKAASLTLGCLGGSHFMWNVKHNIIHHAYTNIDGIDDDIDAKPFLRMAATQKNIACTSNSMYIYGFSTACVMLSGFFSPTIKNILPTRCAICRLKI